VFVAGLKRKAAHHGQFRVKAAIPFTGLHFFKFGFGHPWWRFSVCF
jgi:hypothetical protein